MMDNKDLSWAWVTGSRRLTQGACELVYVFLDAGAADDYATLYNGVDTSAETIAIVRSASKRGHTFNPRIPVFCSHGLYVGLATATTRVFIQWRELPQRIYS